MPPHQCMYYCFLLFWDLGQSGGPPLGSAPPMLLLTCCPSFTMHHSVLLLSSSVTSIITAFFLLSAYSVPLSDSRCLCSPLQLSPRVSSPCLCMSAQSLTFFLSWPLLSANSCFSPLSLHLHHEDSAPAEVDELPQPQWAGEEREKLTRRQRREAEEGRSQRHLEQVRQIDRSTLIFYFK